MMKKIILGAIGLILVVGVCGYFYLYKSHRDISDEEPVATLSAQSLQQKFSTDYDKSIANYLNKTLEVKGLVTELTDSTVVIDNAVFCSLLNSGVSKKESDSITLKGRCLGYDELFEQVKLDQCSIK